MVGKVTEIHFPISDRGGRNPEETEIFFTSPQRRPAGMIGAFTDSKRTTVVLNLPKISASKTHGLRPAGNTRFFFAPHQPVRHLSVVLEGSGSSISWSTEEKDETTQVTVSHELFP